MEKKDSNYESAIFQVCLASSFRISKSSFKLRVRNVIIGHTSMMSYEISNKYIYDISKVGSILTTTFSNDFEMSVGYYWLFGN